MSNNHKVLLARCLENTREFLNEAMATATNGTQSADMGLYKKFCTNLVNVAIPNLIASDLVITKPMASMSGYITYLKYSASTTKGATTAGDVFNTPFALSNMDENYTGEAVVESFTAAATPVAVALTWDKAVKGVFEHEGAMYDVKLVDKTASDAVSYVNLDTDGKIPASAQTASHEYKVAYKYDNKVVPQNDLPRIKAEMVSIPLVAKAYFKIGPLYSNVY